MSINCCNKSDGIEGAPLLVEKHTDDDGGIQLCGWRVPSLLPHGGLGSSAFNLASATLGAGTLALPSAMESSGYVIGILFLVLCSSATLYTIRLLARIADKTGLMSFEDMSRELLGSKKFEYMTQFVIVIFCWGCTIVYVVAIGNVLSKLQGVSGLPDAFQGTSGLRVMTALFWGCFMLPLSLAKEINTLRYASAAGILSTCLLVVAVVVHSADYGQYALEMVPAKFDLNMVQALPVVMFAFTCQTNAFEIYTELRPRTVFRMSLSSAICLTTCTTIYIIIGVAGYADFGTKVHGNILNNYSPMQHPLLAAAFIGITVTLTMAFPICIFPTRDAICHLFGFRDAYSTPTKYRLAICGTLATMSLVCGMFTPSIRTLFGVLGGACGSIIGFILPTLFAIRSERWVPSTVGWFHFLTTYIILVGGFIGGVLGTVVSVMQIVK